MHQKLPRQILVMLTILTVLSLPIFVSAEAIIADHNAVVEFDLIDNSYFDQVRSQANIFYMHTSHGRQILDGIDKLTLEDPIYSRPTFAEYASDAGANWVPYAQDHLNNNPDCNMFIISWCGQLSSDLATRVPGYLDKMSQLEAEYPAVTFVYMTGHLDGTGISGPLKVNNDLIRDYCAANNKVLFDFADIESYDPDGNYYPNDSETCAWCDDWCGSQGCADDCVCAHSHCYNCYIKGKAFWWMMARLWGWSLVLDVDDTDPQTLPTMISLHQNYPNPFNPATGIVFSLPRSSFVRIDILNVTGQLVATLTEAEFEAGTHSLTWRPDAAASGIYFYRMETDGYSATRKMVYLK
jgi:hypothetical protein